MTLTVESNVATLVRRVKSSERPGAPRGPRVHTFIPYCPSAGARVVAKAQGPRARIGIDGLPDSNTVQTLVPIDHYQWSARLSSGLFF